MFLGCLRERLNCFLERPVGLVPFPRLNRSTSLIPLVYQIRVYVQIDRIASSRTCMLVVRVIDHLRPLFKGGRYRRQTLKLLANIILHGYLRSECPV